MVNELQLKLTGSTGSASRSINSLVKKLNSLTGASKEAKKELGFLERVFGQTAKSVNKAEKSYNKFLMSIKRIAFYRLVRGAIKAVTEGLREGVNNLVQYSALMNSLDASRANATMSEFATISLWVKNTVGSAVMPVLQALVPVVNAIAEAFIFAANAVNQFIKGLQGSQFYTEALKYNINYADSLDGVGKAAKEAKKQLFGFDELNVFNDNSGTGSGLKTELDYSSMFKETEISDGFARITEAIRTNLANIEKIAGGFALAAGVILLLTGHIGTGIAAFVAGAALLWGSSGVNWDSLGNTIQEKLGSLVALSAPTLLALGTILLLTGHIGLGIGGILAGIAATGISGAFGWDDNLRNDIKTKLETLILFTSLTMVAYGTILAFTGNIPLGIGLMAAGLASFGTYAAVNWDILGSTLSARITSITTIISTALLAVGAILFFASGGIGSAAGAKIGLGMMAAGAVGLAGTAVLSWDAVPEKTRTIIGVITGIVSAASLALGALLVFGAGGTPGLLQLGLGLMAAGAAGLATSAHALNITEWAKEKFGELDTKVDEFVESLLEKALNTGKDFVENLKTGISDKWNSFKSWLSGKSLNINARVNADYDFGSLPGRASGGFVDSGQIFMARENGIPELVGSMGNQTAVANNAQIVEGIASGVESAMDNTNSVILQMANAIVNAIAEKQINTQVISDRDIYRSAERGRTLSGATVIS